MDINHHYHHGKARWPHKLQMYLFEIYILSFIYFRRLYQNTYVLRTLLAFYIGFALLLGFAFFRLGETMEGAAGRVSALNLIRLSITVNTMASFVSVFRRARKEEIAGFGKNRIAFEPTSVYIANFLALASFRILLFIPFTAIVYPLVGLRGGFDRVMVFFLALVIQQMATISVAMLVAAIFIDPNVAGVVISTVVLVTFLFGGNIIPPTTMPSGLSWLQYLSISFYANQALIHNEFDNVDFPGDGTGRQFLRSQQLHSLEIWPAMGALLLYALISNILGIIALHLTSRRS